MILVTLVCCYAACWGPTCKYGPDDVVEFVQNGSTPGTTDCSARNASGCLPLIVTAEEFFIVGDFPDCTPVQRHYFWFFGYVAKLPFERDVPLARGLADSTYDGVIACPGENRTRVGWMQVSTFHPAPTDPANRSACLATSARSSRPRWFRSWRG